MADCDHVGQEDGRHCGRCGRDLIDLSNDTTIRDLRARLDGATQFQFWGASGRRGDYVLVCFDDEEDDLPWQLQVYTCENSSMFGDDVHAYKTQDEATSEAIRLAATLTKMPGPTKATPGTGGLVPRDEGAQ